MRIHLRYDDANSCHTKMTVFVNGVNSGQLIVGTNEADYFRTLVRDGCEFSGQDEFQASGRPYNPEWDELTTDERLDKLTLLQEKNKKTRERLAQR